MVSAILDNIAAGVVRADILASYPSLKPQDIDAVLAYAAELARLEIQDRRKPSPGGCDNTAGIGFRCRNRVGRVPVRSG